MPVPIESTMLSERPTAVLRATLRADQLPGWLAGTYPKVDAYLRRTGARASGEPFARYVFHGDEIAMEAGFPVERPVAGG